MYLACYQKYRTEDKIKLSVINFCKQPFQYFHPVIFLIQYTYGTSPLANKKKKFLIELAPGDTQPKKAS